MLTAPSLGIDCCSTSWEPLQNDATLFATQSSLLPPSTSFFKHEDQLTAVSHRIETIDLVVNNLDDGDHPFHLHGHTFSIVAHGVGRYVPRDPENDWGMEEMYQMNRDNPMRRDTIVIPGFSFAVLRFTTDNPGLWAFHCHITW